MVPREQPDVTPCMYKITSMHILAGVELAYYSCGVHSWYYVVFFLFVCFFFVFFLAFGT